MPFLVVSEPPPASTSLPPVSMPAFPANLAFGSPMTGQEAEDYLRKYRAMLKSWTMAVAGFSDADSDTLYARLEEGQQQLAEIALAHPDKSYSVDTLINSRSRSWAGFAMQRAPRPAQR